MQRSRIRRREDNANRVNNGLTRRAKMPKIMNGPRVTKIVGSEMLNANLSVSTTGVFSVVPINFFNNVLNSTWVGRQSSLYNKYKFTRLTLRYVPYCPTSQPGRIILAWNGDPGDAPPTTMPQVSQYQNSVEAPAWRETSCNALITKAPEFVVGSATTSDSGGATTQGEFYIGADGGATSSQVNVGSLYIDYELSLWSRAAFATNT